MDDDEYALPLSPDDELCCGRVLEYDPDTGEQSCTECGSHYWAGWVDDEDE